MFIKLKKIIFSVSTNYFFYELARGNIISLLVNRIPNYFILENWIPSKKGNILSPGEKVLGK